MKIAMFNIFMSPEKLQLVFLVGRAYFLSENASQVLKDFIINYIQEINYTLYHNHM